MAMIAIEKVNRQVRLVARPQGEPTAAHFRVDRTPLPEPGPGQVVVRNLYASIDPAMRGWVRGQTYVEPVPLDGVMRAITVGRVVTSRADDLPVGAAVTGLLGLQDYAVTTRSAVELVDERAAPLRAYCGGLGMTGQTAYFGTVEVARPQAGETVLVSSAAGATGSVAGQIARVMGCRAVGIAGGAAKCGLLVRELGFDAAIDYTTDDLDEAIAAACPDGVDVYFDNVGGPTLDAALLHLNRGARVVVCGAISQTGERPAPGPRNLIQLAFKHARMEGFVVFEYRDRFPEATAQLARWLADGRLKLADHVEAGLERFPEVLGQLFRGDKIGKLVLQIGEDR
ncbi:MAG TPA: NADP-dependent oxidoreductase [Phenylobacterium sp.]